MEKLYPSHKRQNMLKTFFLILSTFFIVTLSWHVSYPSNVLVFGSIFLLIILYPKDPFPIEKELTFLIAMAFLLYLFFGLINLTFHDILNFKQVDIFTQKLLLSIFVFTFVLIFFKGREEILFKSIEYALWIIIALWFMQFIVYYTTGEYIDLLEPIAGRPQRYQAYFINSNLSIDFIRPTSIYIEPGTYVVNVLPLLILNYLDKDKITSLHVLTLITFFASLSLFGIIVGTLFTLIVGLRRFKFQINLQMIFFLLLLVLIAFLINEYLYFRFISEANTGAIGIREGAIEYWLTLDGNTLLLGLGNANTIFENPAFIDDTSFLFKLLFEYGIFALPFLLFIGYISWGLPFVFLLLILITKLHYLIYTFWFYLAVIYLLKSHQKEEGY